MEARQTGQPASGQLDDQPLDSHVELLGAIGDRVRLRPVEPGDYGALYWMDQDPSVPMGLRRFDQSVGPERYAESLWLGVSSQLAIVSTSDAVLLGVIALTNVNDTHGIGSLSLTLRPDLVEQGWPREAIGLFLDHIFVSYPLRKVYIEVLESLFGLYAGGTDVVFAIEGQLAGHRWSDGVWQDLLILAVHREPWLSLDNATRGGLGELLMAPELASE